MRIQKETENIFLLYSDIVFCRLPIAADTAAAGFIWGRPSIRESALVGKFNHSILIFNYSASFCCQDAQSFY
jgi:hypothetical protein